MYILPTAKTPIGGVKKSSEFYISTSEMRISIHRYCMKQASTYNRLYLNMYEESLLLRILHLQQTFSSVYSQAERDI